MFLWGGVHGTKRVVTPKKFGSTDVGTIYEDVNLQFEDKSVKV
jgi:hypothetical protein